VRKCVECLQVTMCAYVRMICEIWYGLLLMKRGGGSNRVSQR